MTDRELLELAAKAAGYDTGHPMNRERLGLDPPVDALWISEHGELVNTGWNPLIDNGAAFGLAVKMQISVIQSGATRVCEDVSGRYLADEVDAEGDGLAATRRAIVRAAAAIGGAM